HLVSGPSWVIRPRSLPSKPPPGPAPTDCDRGRPRSHWTDLMQAPRLGLQGSLTTIVTRRDDIRFISGGGFWRGSRTDLARDTRAPGGEIGSSSCHPNQPKPLTIQHPAERDVFTHRERRFTAPSRVPRPQ